MVDLQQISRGGSNLLCFVLAKRVVVRSADVLTWRCHDGRCIRYVMLDRE